MKKKLECDRDRLDRRSDVWGLVGGGGDVDGGMDFLVGVRR